ncbi:Planctomycete cytochrome C [Planctomycetes bacterium MalM25]|nr:Planctomycete cytochrome C [Planctomycetes bacterium MalM25]
MMPNHQDNRPARSLTPLLLAFVSLAGAFPTVGFSAEPKPLSFNLDVRPILSEKCFHCHGPDEESRGSGLRLDVRDEAIDFGAITPHETEESTLLERIDSDDADLLMPPPASKRTLTDKQRAVLRRWIEEGAEYEAHWSLSPLPKETLVPSDRSVWARSDLDHFVEQRLEEAGLAPNLEADRETWLRRVTFDLTGMPPTPAEIDAFLDDQTAKAYERVVDRLLESDAHAERMASEWLDVARYSDSYGYQRDDKRYVWPWRDWVVKSFKRNQPYDEFVTWQLAGDLLPEATREQKLATAFCRLHSHKKEGGVAVEEFRVENVADRTHTFSAAFLGLTMECARCHDHKYDPLTTKEYYELSSFFANLDERGLISYFTDATPTPAMPLPSPKQEERLEATAAKLAEAESQHAAETQRAAERFEAWLATAGPADAKVAGLVTHIQFEENAEEIPEELLHDEDTGFVAVEKKKVSTDKLIAFKNGVAEGMPALVRKPNQLIPGRDGQAVRLTGDDSIVIPKVGQIRRHEPLSVSIWIKPSEIDERAVIFRRSGGWDDAGSRGYALVKRGARLRANLVHFWPGNAIAVETDDLLKPDEWRHITFTYDGSSQAAGLKIYVDGEDATAHVVQDHLTRDASNWRGGYLDLAIGTRYRDRGFKEGVVDDFRVYDRCLSPIEVRHALDEESLTAALAAEETSTQQRDQLLEYYLAAIDEPLRSTRAALSAARKAANDAMDAIPAITVMREQPEPRPAYVLERGVYDSHGEEVTAGTPASLPPFPADASRNRLGLAQWLLDPDHPLTARVVVNRYWQMLFGEGLVRTPEDFGSQGAPPTHPELLDWLARDFVDHGWDVRRMLREIVLSSTYRQSSVVDPRVREIDPENRLLSRAPGKRLTAEMLRDNALAVSGLLVDRVGGPPVKPYDLPLAYTPLDADKDEKLYRRSLYTFWKRTSPSPVMMTMNASRREVCMLKREVTSSPLQALVLLNGTQFIEASRMLAATLVAEHDADPQRFVPVLFRKLIGRDPGPDEADILVAAYEEQLAEYQAKPERAAELLQVGSAPNEHDLPVAPHAAATVLVNSVMNLDECLRCR